MCISIENVKVSSVLPAHPRMNRGSDGVPARARYEIRPLSLQLYFTSWSSCADANAQRSFQSIRQARRLSCWRAWNTGNRKRQENLNFHENDTWNNRSSFSDGLLDSTFSWPFFPGSSLGKEWRLRDDSSLKRQNDYYLQNGQYPISYLAKRCSQCKRKWPYGCLERIPSPSLSREKLQGKVFKNKSSLFPVSCLLANVFFVKKDGWLFGMLNPFGDVAIDYRPLQWYLELDR